MKFKIGDRVEIVKPIPKRDEIYKGNIVTISWIDPKDDDRYAVKENGSYWRTCELKLVKPKQFTLNDLKERYIVKFRNGNEYIVKLKKGILKGIENGIEKENYNPIENYNYYLIEKNGFSNLDIVEVYKPKYETIWAREEEPIKEMTVAEIEKELGYTIKVIK